MNKNKPLEEKKIWLSPPHMSGNETKYVQEAIESNWVTQGGPFVKLFEEKLEQYLGNNVSVAAVSSGTAAIHLALQLLGVTKDDFVICQSLTFVASANPILYLGAIPIFVDSEPKTWNICPNAVEDAIKYCLKKGKKPKAIIAVTLYGMPYLAEEITQISKKYDIPIIEDSAEALGSKYNDKHCGTFGDISVFSFNGNKIITTSGGGALVVKNKELKEKAIWLATQSKENCPHYEHHFVGYNYRMSNISAAIGCAQMEVLQDRIDKRRKNHKFYRDLMEGNDEIEIFGEPSAEFKSNFWLNVVLVNSTTNEADRNRLIERLDDNGIEIRPVWKPMHLQKLFEDNLYFGGNFSEKVFFKGLCLPSGSNLNEGEMQKVVKNLF